MAKILIIDDDADLREMLHLLLSQSDHQVLLAADGLEGLRLAWESHPDLIILDVMLPTVDGNQVLRRLKGMPETQDIPVIMLTAVSTSRQVQDLIGRGATDYIVKPFEPHVLLERLKRVAAVDRNKHSRAEGAADGANQLFALVAAREDWRVSLLARYLAKHGPVEVTASAFEALAIAMATAGSISMILTEPFLPDLDGPDLVHRLRSDPRTARTYLVALVAHDQTPEERARLLGAGFDDILPLPPTHEQVQSLAEHARQPRTSLARIQSGVVVLAVLSLNSATAVRRLRDAMLDFQRANLDRLVIDLSYAEGAAAALDALGPFLTYLVGQGVKVRLAAPASVIQGHSDSIAVLPPVFPSVEDALQGWA